MMNSNLNLSALPECKFAYQMVNSALLIPCAEYQRVLHFYVAEQLEISQGGGTSTMQTWSRISARNRAGNALW